jgi:hypothetical protein
LAANDNRLPPPFWRTAYFVDAVARPDRPAISLDDVKRAAAALTQIKSRLPQLACCYPKSLRCAVA